jgi:hypothetical protein
MAIVHRYHYSSRGGEWRPKASGAAWPWRAWVSSDRSQFCHHFGRQVGDTPGRFRIPARIA